MSNERIETVSDLRKCMARVICSAMGFTEISVAEQFWCNWQIKQSLHPGLLVETPPWVSGSTTEPAWVEVDVVSPCRCAASTVVP